MKNCTKDLIGVCVAKINADMYADCHDGSYEMMEYSYREELANLKHSIEGKNWVLNYKGVEYKGYSFDDTLKNIISNYRIGDVSEGFRLEVEE